MFDIRSSFNEKPNPDPAFQVSMDDQELKLERETAEYASAQDMYLKMCIVKGDEKEETRNEKVMEWISGGFAQTFRLFWDNNPISEESNEGFRDLCMRALNEREEEKQKAHFEEISSRLGDGELRKKLH